MDNQQNLGGFCSKCGTPHKADALFCANCGNKFADQILPQFTSTKQASPAFNNFDGTNYSTFVNNNQPTPPPQAQYTQPQFVQPQVQYAQPVQPQVQYAQPVQPQVQYAQPIQPQQPQAQYASSAIRGKASKLKTISCILLFIAILLVSILPLFSYSRTRFNTITSTDLSPEDIEHVKIFYEEESLSIIKGIYQEFRNIANANLDNTSSASWIIATIVYVVGAILFLVFAHIFTIKGIIALCKKDYTSLALIATNAVKLLMLIFMIYTVFGGGETSWWPRDGWLVPLSYGTAMGIGAIVGLVIAIILIVVAIIFAAIENRYDLTGSFKPRLVKNIIAFAGLLLLSTIMLSQNAQTIYNWAMSALFYDIDIDIFLVYIPVCVLHTTLGIKMIKELVAVAQELLYYSYEDDATLKARNQARPSEPNLVSNMIFATLIMLVNIITKSMEYRTYIPLLPLIVIAVIAIGVYIPYAIFKSKEKKQRLQPMQQYAPQPQYTQFQ